MGSASLMLLGIFNLEVSIGSLGRSQVNFGRTRKPDVTLKSLTSDFNWATQVSWTSPVLLLPMPMTLTIQLELAGKDNLSLRDCVVNDNWLPQSNRARTLNMVRTRIGHLHETGRN